MTIEQALALVDEVICDRTGKPLNDLQAIILREVWQGKKYLEIADLVSLTGISREPTEKFISSLGRKNH